MSSAEKDVDSSRAVRVLGRDRELRILTGLAQVLVEGSSAALVVHGEPGIGKTTILERFIASEASCQIKRCSAVESEMELAWAGLHQLCASMLDFLPSIPAPQSAALMAAFGMAAEGRPDPLLCGLAVLSLLTEAAEKRPVICVIEDAYALDRATLQTLGFVSRRLQDESVGVIFSVREIPLDLARLPDLRIGGLATRDAEALFDAVTGFRLDPSVRDRVIAETHGNPLAIVEFADHRKVRRLAGGYDVPGSLRGSRRAF